MKHLICLSVLLSMFYNPIAMAAHPLEMSRHTEEGQLLHSKFAGLFAAKVSKLSEKRQLNLLYRIYKTGVTVHQKIENKMETEALEIQNEDFTTEDSATAKIVEVSPEQLAEGQKAIEGTSKEETKAKIEALLNEIGTTQENGDMKAISKAEFKAKLDGKAGQILSSIAALLIEIAFGIAIFALAYLIFTVLAGVLMWVLGVIIVGVGAIVFAIAVYITIVCFGSWDGCKPT